MTLLQARTTKLSLCVVVFFVASGFATDIPVTNGSFETPPAGGINTPCAGPGCFFSTANILGWTNPPSKSGQLLPSTSGPNRLFNETAPGSGPTSAYVSANGTIEQTVGATVEEGVTYTLTLEIGHVTDSGFGGSAELLVANRVFTATGTIPTPGNWSTFTASFTGDFANVGDSITIDLRDTGLDTQGNFDSVSLTSSSGPPIPEPSSMLLLGSGVLGLAQVIRRKRS
jgi:hypothetical protein